MSRVVVEPVADIRADVGEGPSWDRRTETLLFVDVTPGAVYRYDPADGSCRRFHAGQEVGAAIPAEAGGLVLAMRDGIYTCADDGRSLQVLAPIGANAPDVRMNDAKCDPAGRLWAGTMAFDFAAGAADLYSIDGAGRVRHVLCELTISNGLGWSPDGTRMYFIDSATYRVDVMDYDATTGQVRDRRPFVTGDADQGMPDGMCVDAEGGVWVAYFSGGQVRRYDIEGSLSEVIDLPVRQVTSCCFGGPDLQDLFITTAAFRLGAGDLVEQPLAGALFHCRPGVAGQPTTMFASRA